MAWVAGMDKRLQNALTTFLSTWKAERSAKLSLKSDDGDLSVNLELKIGHYSENSEADRGHQNLQRRQVGPSQFRRRQRRAADQAVQQRAAEHAAAASLTPPHPPSSC